jgi:Fic family protein
MITIDKMLLLPDLLQRIENLDNEITKFRNGGELDQLSKEKLREYFRTQHIYHSAGIEGNRLTLQETMLVLKEGITISEKSIQDTVEVKNLGIAFDFFYELAQQNIPITENYLKQIHQLVVGNDPYLNAGNYRNVGVIITGSAHTPPEPFEIQFKMQELMDWLNDNYEQENPIILAAVVRHELAKIHPFSDGNGRTARLLLNLILMKKGYPICSIKRTERPRYYEAMSDADNGNYHQIVELVAENCYES